MSEATTWQHPTGTVPASVAVVGLGPSRADFFDRLTAHEPGLAVDEIWAINTGLRYTPHDVAFVMDDVADYADRFPAYGDALRAHAQPIITNTAYADFPATLTYPLEAVLAACAGTGMWRCFYHNSIPYVLAYALAIGVKSIRLYGIDYTHPDVDAVEQGREVCAAWIGFLRGRGIEVLITDSSSMLQARRVHDPLWRWFYGYLRQPAVKGVTR